MAIAILGVLAALLPVVLSLMTSHQEKKASAAERDERIDHAVSKGGDALGGVLHRTLDRLRRHHPEL